MPICSGKYIVSGVYIYIYIFKGFAPCRRPLCQQATADRLTAEMGHFLYLKLSFWRPWGSILGTWDTILVILGSRGTPNGHTEAQRSSFIDFRVDLGSLLGPTLDTFLWFSVILGGKMGDSFQVHVFNDLGRKMMPECNGCMCYNHSKNCVFWMISLFPLFH